MSRHLPTLFAILLLSFPLTAEPLPEKPGSDLASTVETIIKVKKAYPNSTFAAIQVERWLDQLPHAELVDIQETVPTPWSSSELNFRAMESGIQYHLEHLTDRPLTRGFNEGHKDWREALKKAQAIENLETRSRYLIGIITTAGSQDSFQQAQTLRETILPQLSHSQQHHITAYGERWLALWPTQSIAAYGKSLSEDRNFSLIRNIMDQGNMFFADYPDAEKYLQHFGKSAPGQASIVGRSMGPVLAARTPQKFMAWFEEQDGNMRSSAIQDSIEPLLRNNLRLIDQIISLYKEGPSFSTRDVAREWVRYEPVKAKEWAASLPAFKKYGESFIFDKRSRPLPDFQTFKHSQLEVHQKLPRPSGPPKDLNILQLANLAHPGAPPIANTELCENLFSLDLPTTKSRFLEFTKRQPKDAREMLVRSYLLESWILYEPVAACEWILSSGDGRMRSLLPLAFRHMEERPLPVLKKLLNKIPESEIYQWCLHAIGISLIRSD